MLTDLLRDQAFTIAWFGLMTAVWLGWSQEDPEPRHRVLLGIGSSLGIALAIGFGVVTATSWSGPSALEGRYPWFGMLVVAEVVAAGLGCLLLARRGRSRWMAWWVAVVVALHFLPLALLLDDASIAVVGVVQVIGLAVLAPRLRGGDRTTSRVAGPWMGATLLAYAAISAVVLAIRTLT